MKEDITKRREAVLEALINCYIDSAEPVGSRLIAKHMGLSSATIRNVMQDLEEEDNKQAPRAVEVEVMEDMVLQTEATTQFSECTAQLQIQGTWALVVEVAQMKLEAKEVELFSSTQQTHSTTVE